MENGKEVLGSQGKNPWYLICELTERKRLFQYEREKASFFEERWEEKGGGGKPSEPLREGSPVGQEGEGGT